MDANQNQFRPILIRAVKKESDKGNQAYKSSEDKTSIPPQPVISSEILNFTKSEMFSLSNEPNQENNGNDGKTQPISTSPQDTSANPIIKNELDENQNIAGKKP